MDMLPNVLKIETCRL